MEDNKVKVRIYGQEYTISGERDEETIIEIAGYVDNKMREISRFFSSSIPGSLAVLASINIADELFESKRLRRRKSSWRKTPRTTSKCGTKRRRALLSTRRAQTEPARRRRRWRKNAGSLRSAAASLKTLTSMFRWKTSG